ncbi:SurA N-terminal domain-containing protein [Clostridium mediterraneense]|uniref:SurA N-terminal domain-containing protein n=1 Tax=Clostridium mediterraneense TaxID=1805472 RepID=UPI00082C7774|nr:SurA N-terminal domain-containing protein [Clostridium mediterraneense]
MKSIKRIVGVAVVIAAVAAVAVGTGMIQKTPAAIQKTVVGKVYNTDITVAQVEKYMAPYYQQLEQQYSGNLMDNADAKKAVIQDREEVLNYEILQPIIDKQIQEQKITATPEEIQEAYNKQLDAYIKQAGSKEAGQQAFDAALKQNGLTEETYKQQLAKSIQVQKLTDIVTKDVKPATEAEAQTYYNENKSQFVAKQAGAVVYDIVVNSKADADKLLAQYKSETANMTSVEDKLAVFKKIASANNVDSSKSDGGALGFIPFDSQQYQAPFMTAVKGLKAAGDVSAVVQNEGPNGAVYNIAFASEVNLQPTYKNFADEKQEIIDYLTNQKKSQALQAKVEEWKKAAGVEVFTNKLDYAIPAQDTQAESNSASTGTTANQ